MPKSDLLTSTCENLPSYLAGDAFPANIVHTDLARSLACFFSQVVQLADRKQRDYGSDNLTEFGPLGILVRANDKLARLRNLLQSGREIAVADESLLDTWADLCNYGAIGYLMQAELWPRPAVEEAPSLHGTVFPAVSPPRPAPTPPPPGVALPEARSVEEAVARFDEIMLDLFADTRQKVLALVPSAIHEQVPVIGTEYLHRRAPFSVRCLGLALSASPTSSVPLVQVLFIHLDEGEHAQFGKYLRTEPLGWWIDSYSLPPHAHAS